MSHYHYHAALHTAWEKAVERYRAGHRGAEGILDEEDLSFLASIGTGAQEIYDYAEDFVQWGEPDFATVAMVHDIRRSYFLERQAGEPTGAQIDPAKLPAKDAELHGIRWLPRIIEKAKAKLRGELHPDVMYGCGGDREFLRTHDIHPAEFLRLVEGRGDEPEAVAAWVEARSGRRPAGVA